VKFKLQILTEAGEQ